MSDPLSDDATVIEILRIEKQSLVNQNGELRRSLTATEAKCNRLAMDNVRLIRQHEDDTKLSVSTLHENLRLRNRCTILEATIARLRVTGAKENDRR